MHRYVLIVLVLVSFCSSKATAQIVHPGVAHSEQDIQFIKDKVRGQEEPWFGAWKRLQQSRQASLDYEPKPFEHVERGPYNDPDQGSSEFSSDGYAAYIHSILWVIGGNEQHAKKSAEIINAWSAKLKKISNHDARLLTGMSGYRYCVAAELLKHTWDGWQETDQQRFAKMLRDVFYPLIKDFYPSANGNWDASMMQMVLAMGVHLDDQSFIDKTVDYFKNGVGNGAVGNYINDIGQCQESGRDQGHTQMGLAFLSNVCQTASIQGIDLYGVHDNRLLKGFEYTAKYNLGEEVPFKRFASYQGRYDYRKVSDKARGRLRPMYEKVVSHYKHKNGISAPYSLRAVNKTRSKSSRPTSSALDTLMFAKIPASGKSTKLGTQPADENGVEKS